MRNNRRLLIYVFYVVLGVILSGMGYKGMVDEFWNGMGTALIVVGVLRLVRIYRFEKDDNYRERFEIEVSDERNSFIRNKAWAWAGYLFILITAAGVIIFKVMGQETLSMAASCAVCLVLVLYWGAYYILRRKY